MRKYLFGAILLTSLVLVHCATEQRTVQSTYVPQDKCYAPVWSVGDSWRYKYDDRSWREYRVEKVEGDFYVIKPTPFVGYMFGYDKGNLHLKTYINSEGKKIIPTTESSLLYDFPLYVGKKWSKMLQGLLTDAIQQDYLYTFEVISLENVTVSAGTFKAFKIEVEQNRIGSGNTAISHIWYSPDVKNLVKYQIVTSYAMWRIAVRDYGLVTYKLAVIKKPAEYPKPPPTFPIETSKSFTPPHGVEIVQKPQLMEGDMWVRQTDKGKFIWEVDKADHSGIILKQGQNKYYYDTDFAFVKRVSKENIVYEHHPPNRGALFFPLWVGKKWQNKFIEKNIEKGTIYNFDELVEVKDWEDVQTPLGIIKALKIEITTENLDTKRHWTYTLWYSPEIKNYVKSSSNHLKDRNWILANHSLKKVETQSPEISSTKTVEPEMEKSKEPKPQPPKKKQTNPSPM